MTSSAQSERAAGRPPLRARDRLLPLGQRTYVMAILNLTDNSFSGDGTGADISAAVRRAALAAAEGADILDIGAESARADVPGRNGDEEASFVGDAIRRISAEVDALISVDTYKPEVATAALEAGASILNDIGSQMNGPSTIEVAARFGAALVINYTSQPPKMRPTEPPEYEDLIGAHIAYFRERIAQALRAGVKEDAIILDPGIAFGKSHDEDLEVLRRLGDFRQLGPPLLVAASRKHFMGSVTGLPPEDRDDATIAVTALNVAFGADIVRVHSVSRAVSAVRMADAIVRGKLGDYAAAQGSWPWWREAAPLPGTTIRERD